MRDNGGESNGASETPSISGDGRHVAFASGANNLVAGYANGEVNVYVFDRTNHSIVGISVPFGAFVANRNSLNPAFSRDGNFVAFEFTVDKSIDSTPGYQYRDIYLYNRVTRAVERITGSKVGLDADGTVSRSPSISADGRYTAFQSNLEDFDFYDTNFATDVFVYDRIDGVTRRASGSSTGQDQPYQASINPSISGDGRHVAFESQSTNLVSLDTNDSMDIFMKDLITGGISRISVSSTGVQADDESFSPSLSFDGRCVAFQSYASNLASGDANGVSDVFVAVTDAPAPSGLADLASLASNLGALSPGFSPGVTSYSSSVANEVTTAFVRPIAADADATIEVRINSGNYSPVVSNTIASLPLNVGLNTINVKVTAKDGITVRTNSIAAMRAASNVANLSDLSLSAGTLTPIFLSSVTNYYAGVENETASLTVTPTVADSTATAKVNGTSVASGSASGPISLNVGPNVVTTVVTAQDGTTKTNTITVTRDASSNADLVSLVPVTGTLAPAFASGTTDYAIELPNATTSITVTPTTAQTNATITINGETVTSGTASSAINLYDGTTTISTFVTAPDGVATKTYTVKVTRQSSVDVLPPTITNITRTNNVVFIQWAGPTNAQYQVEWKPTLTPPAWNSFTNVITSPTGLFSFLDDSSQTGGVGATRFYRLVQLP